MWSESIWTKSILGLLLGFLLSMSLAINLGFLLPIPRDVFLLIAVLGGFSFWAGIISWFHCVTSVKRPSLISLLVFVLSALLNAWCYFQGTV